MCAIAGIIGKCLTEKNIADMVNTMKRRGPDDTGIYRQDDCTLLHTRLAIIDPLGGRQPMQLSYRGRSYTIVYNGELYNTEEIRTDLIRLGHRFEGHSDTEVVLHAYAEWQEQAMQMFNGIFAFAVWTNETKTLFFSRDRIGVKPLFYCVRDNQIAFASEIKTIFAGDFIKPELDREGALSVIMLGPGRKPGSGVFHGINSLEPGCMGYFRDGKLEIKRYWKLIDREFTDTFEQAAEKVRYLLYDSIRRQMVSDVEIGTFLSGGLDSSIITAICAKEFSKQGRRLKTFSVDYLNNDRFFEPGKFQPTADTPYIKLMQEQLGTVAQWTMLTPDDLIGALEEATIARDLPGMADVDFSLLAFCGDIRQSVKVALSGECADEIFGGYPWYRDPEVRQREGFPWAQNTVDRSSILLDCVADQTTAQDFVMSAYEDTCKRSDILPHTDPLEVRMKQMVNLNFEWFMQTLLDRKDRMSMFHGLEVRVPFCDYRIAEYMYCVPWKYKDYMGKEKGLLRYAARDLLPDKVLNRKKSPYPKTFDPTYDIKITQKMDAVLASDSPIFSFISKEKLKSVLSQSSQWPWYGQLMRHAQTCAYFVQLDFWLTHYNINLLF